MSFLLEVDEHERRQLWDDPEQTLNLARELMYRCWKQEHADEYLCSMGNLYRGNLGSYYLLWEYSQACRHGAGSNSSSNGNSIYRSRRPLQQAMEGAKKAIESLPWNHKNSPSVLEGEWMGAHCLLAICQYHLEEQPKQPSASNPNDRSKTRRSSSSRKTITATKTKTTTTPASSRSSNPKPSSKKWNASVQTVLQKIATTTAKEKSCADDVLSGRAGALQAIWWLRQECQQPHLGTKLVIQLVQQILQRNSSPDTELFFFSSSGGKQQIPYPGGSAKGTIGILYTLLGVPSHEWQLVEQSIPNARQRIRRTIDHLQQQQLLPQNSSDGDTRQIDWYHGLTGLVWLYLLAAQVYQDVKYLTLAHSICDTILWPQRVALEMKTTPSANGKKHDEASSGNNNHLHGSGSAIGLAHGASGIAFLFLQLSRYSTKPLCTLWERRTIYFIQWALQHHEESTLSLQSRNSSSNNTDSHSLYEGLGGLCSLLMNLHQSPHVNMPMFRMGSVSCRNPNNGANDDETNIVRLQEEDMRTKEEAPIALPTKKRLPTPPPVEPETCSVQSEEEEDTRSKEETPPTEPEPPRVEPRSPPPPPVESETVSVRSEEEKEDTRIKEETPPTLPTEPDPPRVEPQSPTPPPVEPESSVRLEEEEEDTRIKEETSPTLPTEPEPSGLEPRPPTPMEPEPPQSIEEPSPLQTPVSPSMGWESAFAPKQTPTRSSSQPQHFSVPTKKSLFWTLQSETQIGNSEGYTPAMITPFNSPLLTKTPIPISANLASDAARAFQMKAEEQIIDNDDDDKLVLDELLSNAVHSDDNNDDDLALDDLLSDSVPKMTKTYGVENSKKATRSHSSSATKKTPPLPQRVKKSSHNKSSLSAKESVSVSGRKTVAATTEKRKARSKQETLNLLKKKLDVSSPSLKQPSSNPSTSTNASSISKTNTNKTPRLRTSTATLSGSGPKVRLTRSAQLKLAKSQSTVKEATQRRKVDETRRQVESEGRRTKIQQQRSTFKSPTKVIGSGGVRLTRAAQLKLSANAERRAQIQAEGESRSKRIEDLRRKAEEKARQRVETQKVGRQQEKERLVAERAASRRRKDEKTSKMHRTSKKTEKTKSVRKFMPNYSTLRCQPPKTILVVNDDDLELLSELDDLLKDEEDALKDEEDAITDNRVETKVDAEDEAERISKECA